MKIKGILKDKLNELQQPSGFKKYFVNTGWLFFERVIGMAVSFFVGVYVARYLGPADYGLFSYAASFVGLFLGISALGLDSILIRELVKNERKRDELLGTSFILKSIGSILVIIIVLIAVKFTNNDSFTNLLIYIIVTGTIVRSFNVINFYFQSKVLSKYTVYVQIFTSITCAVIKLVLIYFNMSLIYFAIVSLLQSIIFSSGLIVMYIKQKSSLFKWRMNFDLAKKLLKDSWPLILSGIAVSIYMKIDQVMIKNMLDIEAVGNYAVAVKLSGVWYFIPVAITGSLFPAIVNAKKISEKFYYERLQKLYTLIVWIAIVIALPMTFLSGWMVKLLFGEQYNQAGSVLMIHIWVGVFVGLAVVKGKWQVNENLTKFHFYGALVSSIANALLNYFLIPIYGIKGAAVATLISQWISAYFINYFFIELKSQTLLMHKAFDIRRLLK